MKKFVKKMFAGLIAAILITGILPAYTQTAEAATTDSVYKIVRFHYGEWGKPAKVKVYGKYYWNDFSNIYCSSTPDGEGNVIAAAPEGYMIDDHFITNGTRIYYDVKPKDYTKAETIFYYVPNSGKTNPVKIRAVSYNSWLVSYYSYNRKLYTYRYNSTAQAYQLYSLNTKTKQYTRANSNFVKMNDMIWENLNKNKLPKINSSLNTSDDCNLLLSQRNLRIVRKRKENRIRNLQIKIIKGEYVNRSTTSLFHVKK